MEFLYGKPNLTYPILWFFLIVWKRLGIGIVTGTNTGSGYHHPASCPSRKPSDFSLMSNSLPFDSWPWSCSSCSRDYLHTKITKLNQWKPWATSPVTLLLMRTLLWVHICFQFNFLSFLGCTRLQGIRDIYGNARNTWVKSVRYLNLKVRISDYTQTFLGLVRRLARVETAA